MESMIEPPLTEPETDQPAIGVRPEWLWREIRLRSLLAAIDRQYGVNLPNYDLIAEWSAELKRHAKWLKRAKK